ncbi:DUF2335 domain-containing protein [Methylobacterium sp. JK268]
MLEQFRHLVPDAPERIFAAWEAESRHRREWENRALDGQITTTRIGQAAAIAFGLASMGVTCLALLLNQPWVAGVVGGSTVVSVVGAFLYRHAKDERE